MEGRAAGFYLFIFFCYGEAGWGSYLRGSEEGSRGFREDSYEATGTHVRHFQLHRVKAQFRNGKEVERERRLLGTRTERERQSTFLMLYT